MVSINTSTSFLTTSKSEDCTNETDASGLENIFASMLSGIDDDNLGEASEAEKPNDELSLLEEIKIKLDLNKNRITLDGDSENDPGLLASNILQVYQTYKTGIDEAMEVESDSTITFELEKIIDENQMQRNNLAKSIQKIELEKKSIVSKLDEIPKSVAAKDTANSIEEFSELEMQKIKASMKNGDQLNAELDKNGKKKPSATKGTLSSAILQSSEDPQSKVLAGRSKVPSPAEQPNKDINQSIDNSKTESLTEQNQNALKSASGKVKPAESNLQSNNSTSETYLKLLEKNWGKDLAKIIEKAISSGKEKIDISLDPQKLGKMHLTLSVVNNQTSIFISTENASASLILNSAEDRLAQMFESSGYRLSNFQANSNGQNNSDRNGSGAKHNKGTKNALVRSDPTPLIKQGGDTTHTIDGRKIINLIA